MNFDPLLLRNQLCHRFYMVSNAFTRAYRPALEALDLTYPQYVVMMALWEKDGITVKDLLNITQIDGGAMSLMLKKLAQKELIVLSPSEEDKRVKHILLTDKAQKLKEHAVEVPNSLKCKLNHMSPSELSELMTLLDKLQQGIEP